MAATSSVVALRPRAPRLSLESSADEQQRLVEALQEGKAWAERAFVEENRGRVLRLLAKILGQHAELDDLVQEVFIRALARVDTLRETGALKSWLNGITVFVAREAIRKRRRRRWLTLVAPAELPEPEAPDASPEDRATLKAFYEVLDKLAVDRRIVFALRYVEGLELSEIALACDISLSTTKRRLKQAEGEFVRRATRNEALADWMEGGRRWTRQAD